MPWKAPQIERWIRSGSRREEGDEPGPADGDRLPNVFDLYPGLKGQTNEAQPSCSTDEAVRRQEFGINQKVAGEASGLHWQLMRHGGLDRHGAFVYQASGEVMPLEISRDVWRSFGIGLAPACKEQA